MNPCDSLLLSTAPYYREARVTLARRQTACEIAALLRSPHCGVLPIDGNYCALLQDGQSGIRQGVCRIRKAVRAANGCATADDRSKASRIARAKRGSAARNGQCNRQALQLFELLACNGGVKGQSPLRLLGDSKGAILFHEREWPPYSRAAPCGAAIPPAAQRAAQSSGSRSTTSGNMRNAV